MAVIERKLGGRENFSLLEQATARNQIFAWQLNGIAERLAALHAALEEQPVLTIEIIRVFLEARALADAARNSTVPEAEAVALLVALDDAEELRAECDRAAQGVRH
jgi:hypothetical protein